MLTTVKRWLVRLVVLLTITAIIAAAWLALYAQTDLKPSRLPIQFDLRAGSSLKSAAQQMADAGVLDSPFQFVILARLLGEAANIKAGNYEIDGSISRLGLLQKITQGDYTQVVMTVIEGWTFRQLRKALDDHPAVKHDTQGLDEAEILKRLEIDQVSAEGWFFPDTYHFSSGTSDLSILRRAHRLMRSHLNTQWERRAEDLPLRSPYEALILASIIEKETGRAKERQLISGVFINRLRLGMRLQTDPSVIYGMGERFNGNIRKADLIADTAYNTYTRTGLPPTPIAMPGIASIAAALNPQPSKFLYFVAKGDGTSYFSSSLEEHNRAVTKYQKQGRR